MIVNSYKLVRTVYSSNEEEGQTIFEGDFQSFECFISQCEAFEKSGEKTKLAVRFGLTVTESYSDSFWFAGGFHGRHEAWSNGDKIPKDIVDLLIW